MGNTGHWPFVPPFAMQAGPPSGLDVQLSLGFDFFFRQEQAIEQLLEFSPWDRPALESDLRAALALMVPTACSRPLVRIGGEGDGAYLIPDHLEGIEACFSPGVADCTALEQELADRHGIPSYLCDASVREESLSLDGRHHVFSPLWLGTHDGEQTQSLDAWVLGSPHGEGQDLLLQMDIEGSEYGALLACSDSVLAKFRILVLEVHLLERMESARFLNMVLLPVLHKLHRLFDCVHAHPNNCCGVVDLAGCRVPRVLELTYYRRSLNQAPAQGDGAAPGLHPPRIPHPLDVVNVPSQPPIELGPPWTTANPAAGG
jgi:hypothetical protein